MINGDLYQLPRSFSLPVTNDQNEITPMPEYKLPNFKLDPPLEEVLLNPLTEVFFKREDKELINYFVNNIKKLLDTAFHPEDPHDPHLSKLAFEYLRKSNSSINQAFVYGTVLQHVATPILSNSDAPMISLYRISYLTYTALTENPTKFPKNCGYIFQFLSFINELCIHDFFDNIFNESITLEATQNWLVDMNLAILVGNEILKEYPITEYEYLDSSVQRMRHLFMIVKKCLSNPILRPTFLTEEFFNAVTNSMLRTIDVIENERWNTLVALYCGEMADYYRSISRTIFQVVSESVKQVKRFHVSALDLLTLMLKEDRHIRPFLYTSNIQEVLLRLLLQFPDHTFLHLAIGKFFKAAMVFPEYQETLIKNLVSPLIIEGVNSDRTVLVGSSYDMISIVLSESKTYPSILSQLKSVPDFVTFVKNVIVNRIKLIQNGYGGRTPSLWS